MISRVEHIRYNHPNATKTYTRETVHRSIDGPCCMAFDLFLQQLENQLNHNESVLWDCDWEKVSFLCVFFLIRWLKNWIGWSSVVGYKCAVSAFLFLLLLIVVAKHRHNYTWLVCFAGQIKLKLKTKVHNRQCFFVHFIQPNMVFFWECNSLNCSIQMNKRTNTSNSPTMHKKQVQQSFFFWCVTNKRRCSFMVLFRFFSPA